MSEELFSEDVTRLFVLYVSVFGEMLPSLFACQASPFLLSSATQNRSLRRTSVEKNSPRLTHVLWVEAAALSVRQMWREVWWDGRCLVGVGGLAMLLFGQNVDSDLAEDFKGTKSSAIGTLSKMLTLVWRERRTALKGLFIQQFAHSTKRGKMSRLNCCKWTSNK